MMSQDRTPLYISAFAQLFGVSVKTVRHYHKMGLLPEPERSVAGYRLYTAEHVRRMGFIRQLQEAGLSLAQVGNVLGNSGPGEERLLRETLRDVLAQLNERINELHERRTRVIHLLQEPVLRKEELGDADSIYLEEVYQELGTLLPPIDEDLLQQEAQLEDILSRYNWGNSMPEAIPQIIAYFQEHPRAYQQFVTDLQAIWQELKSEPTGDQSLRETARGFVLKHRAIFDQWQILGEVMDLPPGVRDVLGEMLGEVTSWPQQEFGRYLFEEYERLRDDREDS